MLKKKWKRLQGNERFEGFCVELLQEISKITKLNFNLRLVSDAQYGCRDKKSGRWSGMIGEVYSKVKAVDLSFIIAEPSCLYNAM